MPQNRFFLNEFFHLGENVMLKCDEAHHLLRVMRKNEGESVELINGKNQLAVASIISSGKKEVHLKIEHLDAASPLPLSIILCAALPRLTKLDFIVEKGTELGMTELWLFAGDLSEKKEINANQIKRLETISISAMKQCGRLDLPKIELKPPLLKWRESDFFNPSFFGDLSPDAPRLIDCFQNEGKAQFFVGPEAGFSAREEAHLRKFSKGVKLHPFILRTETAPLVALSIFINKI